MTSIEPLLLLGAWLFAIGIGVILIKKNMIMMLIGIELMLNGCNLNLVAFNLKFHQDLDGQMFALFVILLAVCETAVGLAIILRVYRYYQTSVPDEINELKD